ncbi:MAG: hypothetical protein ACEPO2_14700 [Pelagibaca sp.]
MSLTRLAMRLAAARALRGRTLAGDRVFDSAVDPIDQTIAEQRQPLLVLTTDEHELEVEGRDMRSGAHRCELVIELAIAARIEVPADDGQGGKITISIPHTDEGMELTLDLIEHQVVSALTRDDNPWSRVWMKLVPRITRQISRRGASAENGVRFAARQLVLTCDLIDAPVGGAVLPPLGAWAEFLGLMEADPAVAGLASLIRAEIEGELVAEWRRAAEELGLPLEVADALGIGPAGDLASDPAPLTGAIITGGAAPITVTEDDPDGGA